MATKFDTIPFWTCAAVYKARRRGLIDCHGGWACAFAQLEFFGADMERVNGLESIATEGWVKASLLI